MAAVFKRTDRRYWMIEYRNASGKRITKSSRTTDKRAAERIAAKLEADVALRREGVIDATQDDYQREALRPLAEHIADYRGALEGGRSASHAHTQMGRIEKITRAGGFFSWRDVCPDAVERAIGEIAQTRGLSEATRNAYLTAFKAFCGWMVKRRRAQTNPIEHLERVAVDKTEHRRAFLPEEAAALLNAAVAGEDRVGRTRRG